jgi:hypothetical protein
LRSYRQSVSRASGTAAPNDAIRPFRINVPDESHRPAPAPGATRWPEKETVDDDSQGVPLATLQELVHYWQTEYDWRKVEARLNELPQFITEIDGLDIHFIHVRSKHDNALPLIVTHGWPGSIIEQLKIIDPLTNPTANGGSAADAFHLVIPSIPGYGFSGKPTTTGWDPAHIARAWIVMKRLHGRYSAGRRLGFADHERMAKLAPRNCSVSTSTCPVWFPPRSCGAAVRQSAPSGLSADEQNAFDHLKVQFAKRRLRADHGDAPQTCLVSRIHLPVSRPGCSTTATAAQPAASPLP